MLVFRLLKGVRRWKMCVVVGTVGALLLGPASALGQNDEYEEWLKEQQTAYQQYLDEQDEAFLQYLKENEWVRVDVEAPESSPIDDKPPTIPEADTPSFDTPTPVPVEPPEGNESASDVSSSPADEASQRSSEDDLGASEADPAPEANAPAEDEADDAALPGDGASDAADPTNEPNPANEPDAAAPGMRQASTTLFGTSVDVPYAAGATPSMEGPPGKEAIGAFWKDAAQSNLQATAEALHARTSRLDLGDWGYYRAVRALSQEMYDRAAGQEQANAATLWTWSLLVESGYAARVGYNENEVFLMLPSDERLFDRPQLYIDDQRHYIVGVEDRSGFGSLQTYQGTHPEAQRVLSFDLQTMPALDAEMQKRELSFNFDGQTHTLTVDVNPALLEFLTAYPDIELSVLFRAGMSPAVRQSVLSALRPLVRDRSEVEALNLLLRFVQTAFEYEVDQENFGEERFLFPEQTLGAAASDCEDRAVLFAYLVRQLLDLKTAALSYPRHVTTAVHLEDSDLETVGGYQVEVQGETYVMADPTYINAGTGMAMPFVKGDTPEVISVQRVDR